VTSNVQLVFRGEALEGFAPDEVRRRVAQALKLDEHRTAQLFSGARTVLKRSLEPGIARTYAQKLAHLGARVHIEPADAPPTTAFPTLPDLPDEDAAPAPPPCGAPPRPTRAAPLTPAQPHAPKAPVAAVAAGAAAAPDSSLGLQTIEEVTCPNCGERQAKRLLCRNCSTNMEMVLANLREASERARAERLEKFAARHPQRANRHAAADGDSAGIFGLTFEGRMGRLK
jgi:hypothetical protein